MSGVVGRSHCTSTLGGTGLASVRLRGGPGQAVSESECTHRAVLNMKFCWSLQVQSCFMYVAGIGQKYR